MTTRFQGIPLEAVDFYERLSVENTKAFWTAHKSTYDTAVREPLAALLAELEDEFGKGNLFRPYRDVRFGKDKTPYKDHQGAYVMAEDSIGWYLQVSGSGLMIAGGWYSAQGTQLARFRDSVDSPVVSELETAIATATKAGFALGGDVMKTRPRGIAEDHPYVDLLRHRTLTADRRLGTPAWMDSRKALTQVRTQWRAITPLIEWLVDHVGPADDGIPPEPD